MLNAWKTKYQRPFLAFIWLRLWKKKNCLLFLCMSLSFFITITLGKFMCVFATQMFMAFVPFCVGHWEIIRLNWCSISIWLIFRQTKYLYSDKIEIIGSKNIFPAFMIYVHVLNSVHAFLFSVFVSNFLLIFFESNRKP